MVEIGQRILKKKIFKGGNLFLLFPNYLLFKKDLALYLNKLESSSPRDTLCQVWLKLTQWFWLRRFLKVVDLFSLFPKYLPFGKGVVLHLNKLETPSPRDTLCQVWLKLAQFRWAKNFMTKQRQRQTTDKFWSERLTWAFGSD